MKVRMHSVHCERCGLMRRIARWSQLYADDEPYVQVYDCKMGAVCWYIDLLEYGFALADIESNVRKDMHGRGRRW